MDAAIVAANQALEVKANHPDALAMLGSLAMAKSNWSDAVRVSLNR